MLLTALKIRLLTTVMAGWVSATSPAPIPAAAYATFLAGHSVEPVDVKLFDENLRESATVAVARDGRMDPSTTLELERLFRCRQTMRQQPIARATLVMLADLADRFPKDRIEYVSVVRANAGESATSPHRAGRAIDFRIRDQSLLDIRDYLWRTYDSVGIGWYPSEQFIHMDSRPTEKAIAWTFGGGANHYHPGWADRARSQRASVPHHPGS